MKSGLTLTCEDGEVSVLVWPHESGRETDTAAVCPHHFMGSVCTGSESSLSLLLSPQYLLRGIPMGTRELGNDLFEMKYLDVFYCGYHQLKMKFHS